MTSDQSFVLPIKRVRGDTLRERLTQNAYERILPARYLQKNEDGEVIETPEEMFERVARNVASAEREYGGEPAEWETRFYEMLTGLKFIPNSPTLMNAGTEMEQLAACFVMSPEDSIDSIFETLWNAASVMQSGGGVGYSFSALRPRGDLVKSTGGVASGPVSFMKIFDSMCEQIRQGGRRRGAQMGILRVDHPDIGRFCTAKRIEGELSNFNISVGITDEFYDAHKRDKRYPLVNPSTGDAHIVTTSTAEFYSTTYESRPPSEIESNLWRDFAVGIPELDEFRGETDFDVGDEMTLPARFVWELIVDGAWLNGEPGLFMLDETNREHSFDTSIHPEHRIAATNPCGEQGLENYEACTLGHVNLSLVVADDRVPWFEFQHGATQDIATTVESFLTQAIDWEELTRVTHDGTRFLENVTTVSTFPVEEIERKVSAQRKIGLGIMGLAEMLIQFGVRYGTPESFEIARQVMAHINRESTAMSHELAAQRNVFPAWPDSKFAKPTAYSEWFEQHTGQSPTDWPDGFPVRNHSTTTIAPCGTTGMIANTSGGCEPLFNVVYFKNVSEDIQGEEMLVEFAEYFLETVATNGIDVDELRNEAVALLESGEFRGLRDLSLPSEFAELFVSAGEIPATGHVRMQAALQEHVDSAISKTINLPFEASRRDVSDAFLLAVELGCKGVTVFRDRSRGRQVLTTRPDAVNDGHGRLSEARCCPISVDE